MRMLAIWITFCEGRTRELYSSSTVVRCIKSSTELHPTFSTQRSEVEVTVLQSGQRTKKLSVVTDLRV